ncbi:MAG: UPF0262 family protein [Alphaproteobacteria bacterium]|jgi:uncharacterized protein (UPF0262 family)|nr:UPF0262 family protein [Alphaproteobacteria bacterium]
MSQLSNVTLHEAANIRYNPYVQHERDQAIQDLLISAVFQPVAALKAPYALELSIVEDRLQFVVCESKNAGAKETFTLSVKSLRGVIKDYFQITRSYHDLITQAVGACRLEAVDQGRRGIHNEAATQIMEALAGKVTLDHPTARRLFTLICVLHIREQSHVHL